MKSTILTHFAEDLSTDGFFAETEDALERSGRVEDLVKLYQARASELSDPLDGSHLLCRAAELVRNRSNNLVQAEQLFREALLIAPDALEPLKGLKLLYETAGNHLALTAVLERLANQTSGPESASLLLKAADIYETRLQRRDRAVLCCQRASKADPKDRRAFRRIRQLFLFERRYQSALESLERERAALGSAGMSAEYAAFAEQLSEDPFAHELALKALEIARAIESSSPRVEKIRRNIENLKQIWRDRIRVLRTASLEERDPKSAARLSLLVAKLFAFHQPDAAPKIQEALDRCFSLWPGMPEALSLMELMGTRSGEPAAIASAMEKMATRAKDPAVQRDLWMRLGVWRLSKLEDRFGALGAFEQAAQLDPARAEAIGLATELLIEVGRIRPALELLEKHLLAMRDRPAEANLRLRLADLYRLKLQDVGAARRHLEAALRADPFNTQAAYDLAQLYLQGGALEPLESVLNCALHALLNPEMRRNFLVQLVDAFAAHPEPRRGFGVLKKLLRESMRPPKLLPTLLAQAKASHTEWELAVALRHAAELFEEDSLELWRSLAHLLQDPLGRPDDALAAFREVLKRSPNDQEALGAVSAAGNAPAKPMPGPSKERVDLASAMEALSSDPSSEKLRETAKNLAKAEGSGRELARLFAHLAERVPDSTLALTLLREAAQLAEEAGALDDACAMLKASLVHSPDDPQILDLLFELQMQARRIADADQVLRRRILVAEDTEKASLYVRLADVQQQLSKPKEAAEALQKAVKAGASEAEQLPKLSRLLEATGQLDALSKVLARQVELAEKAKDKKLVAELNLRLSELVTASAKGRAEAIQRSAEVLRQRPFDAGAIAGLENLLADPSHREQAARALLPAYEWAKDHRKLVSALDVIASASKDDVERLLSLKRAAYIHLHQLRQPDLAFGALIRALRLSPADAALRNVTRQAAEDADALESFAEILEELLEGELGPARLAIHRELAELYEKKLENPTGAISHVKKALTLEPKNTELLQILQRLYRAREDWEALAEVLERLADVLGDPAQKTELWREEASLYERQLGRKPDAAACWKRIAQVDALDRGATAALERLYTELDQPKELSAALELRRAQEGQSPQGREIAFRLAKLRASRLEDPAGALQLYCQILAEDSSHQATLRALEEIAKQDVEQSAAALEILDPILARSAEHERRVAIRQARMEAALPRERVRLGAEIRAIYEREMRRPELAFAAAAGAFVEGLDRASVQADLERLARDTQSLDELAQIYENAAGALVPGDEAVADLLRRGAEIREQVGQTDQAIRLWREVLAETPQDRKALDALARLYEQSKNATSLSEIFMKKAQLAQQPEERSPLLLKAGAAHEAAGNDAAAIDAYRAALVLQKSVEALEALDRLLGKTQRFAEQADILAQLAELAPDSKAKKGSILRRAALLEREGQPAAALAVYQQAIELYPGEPGVAFGLEHLLQNETIKQEVARILEPLYRASNERQKLVELLEIRLVSSAPEKRFELLNEIANLHEGLGHRAAAFNARLRAFSENPEAEGAREELHRLAAETGAFEELAECYQRQIERGVSKPVLVDLQRRLAAIYEERLNRPEMAARALEQVAEHEPENASVLQTLAATHRKHQAFGKLAEVIQRQVKLERKVPKQINLLFELGKLAEESLADKDLAIEAYREILKRKADDANAIKSLDAALSNAQRYRELAGLIEEEIRIAEARGALEEALELTVRHGRLKFDQLGDAKGALELFESVLRRRPNHPGAVAALEEIARSESAVRADAALILEPLFKSSGEHLKLVQVLDSRIAADPSAQERCRLLCKVAEIYAESLHNPQMAFVAATRALRELPGDPAPLVLCLKLVGPAEAAEDLSTLLRQVGEKATDDVARSRIYAALAQVQEAAGEVEKAAASWQRVLQLEPTHQEALDNVGRLFHRLGKSRELYEVLRRQASVADEPGRRAALLLQMGALQQEQLRDESGALATFRRVLELRPDDPAVLERMEQLCHKLERWPELADVLTKRIRLKPDEANLDLKFRLAQIREARLMDRVGSLELYGEILSADSKHRGALQRLEKIASAEPQNEAAVGLLIRAVRANQDDAKLIQILESRVGSSRSVRERKEMWMELAKLREKQGEPELGFLALWRAFKEDPNDPELRKALERTAELAKTYDELAVAYEEQLPRIAEAKDAAEICLVLGQLFDQRLQEPSRAAEFYEKARQLSAETLSTALPALERLYTQLDRPAELANVLEDLIELASDPQEKAALLFRFGQLVHSRLDDSTRAADAYQRILGLDKAHLAAARTLEEIYQKSGDARRLYQVLEHQRPLVSGKERERILSRMAQVSVEGLSDLPQSIELYRELVAKDPRNVQAFTALESLLEKGGRYEELKELLVQQLGQAVDPRELVRLNGRLGLILLERLGRPEEAIAPLKATLDRDPRHKPSLEALRKIFEGLGRQDELVLILRRLIPLQESAEGVKDLRIRLAEMLSQMGRREEALDAARRSLEIEPHREPELGRLHKIFVALKAYAEAARVLEQRSQLELLLEDRDRAIATMFEIVDLWKGSGGRLEGAAAALDKILEIDPANRQAYERGKELYAQLKDWRAYAQLIDRYLPHLVTEEEKIAALRDLADVQESKLGQKDVAFLAICRALQHSPADNALHEQVERLAAESGSYEELAAVYEEVGDDLRHGPLAERTYSVLAKVYDQKLDDPESAEKALRKILEFDPTNAPALDSLAEMFQRRGRHREYVVVLEQKLEATSSIEARKPILREISRTHDENLSAPAEAVNALLRALALEPDEETMEALVALYRRQRAWPEVATTLIRACGLAATDEQRARMQVEAAQIYERELNDDAGAIVAYREALEFEPTNATALDALERLYTKLDQPNELLDIYQRQFELSADYRDKVKSLFKSASIWESKFQNLENADLCVEQILAIDPQNLAAIRTLERLRRDQGRWDELLGVLDQHAQLSTSAQEQAELWVAMGDLLEHQLRQVDRAATAYHQALELDPQCYAAMHALGVLYERSGNWPFAMDMLLQEAQLLGPTAQTVELYYRVGRIQQDMLLDPPNAKESFLQSLQIDPRYVPAIRAVRDLYEREGDWVSFEQALIQEADATEDTQAKCSAILAVGRYFAEHNENLDAAAEWYEQALRLVPDSHEAAKPLADIYIGRENWQRAERMLEIVTAYLGNSLAGAVDVATSKELCRQLYRLGYVAEKLENKDKALQAYQYAYDLDATYLPALEGLGNSLVNARRFEEAQKVFQTILIHHRDDLTDLEVVEVYWQLGEIHKELKQFDSAQNHFEKALAIDSNHEPSLRALVELADTAERFDKSAEYRQSLLRVLDGEAKYQVCVELGGLAREKLSDAYMAIDAYLAAHRLHPEALPVMDALYILYRETKQGPKAAEILEKMLAVPELRQDVHKAKLVHFALGEIYRDDVKEIDRAVAAFNEALDLDPKFVDAFSAIEGLLGSQNRWKQLEENYVRMIQRLPKTPETHASRMTLWRALGELYLRVLQQRDSALVAYQVVAAGLPDDAAVQESYGDLAAQKPGEEDAALAAYRRALVNTENPGRVCSAFAELAARKKDYDSAFLGAQAVRDFIGSPGAIEKEILTKLSPYAKKNEVAQRALTDQHWQLHLLHPKVRGSLSELMALLYQQLGQLYSLPLSHYELNPKKHRIDIGSAQEYQVHHYRYVARLLGMEAIELYSPFLIATRERLAKRSGTPVPEPQVGVEICHTHPVCLKVGGKFFSEQGQKEVYYWLGRNFALMRPELALSQRLSFDRLDALLQAAITLSTNQYAFTANPRAIEAERAALEKALGEPARVALDRIVRQYLAGATPGDLASFIEGAELTATRAGLFVAGEMEPVKKMVLGETGAAYRVPAARKIRDLMVFAISEDLRALRHVVGTQVEVPTRKG